MLWVVTQSFAVKYAQQKDYISPDTFVSNTGAKLDMGLAKSEPNI